MGLRCKSSSEEGSGSESELNIEKSMSKKSSFTIRWTHNGQCWCVEQRKRESCSRINSRRDFVDDSSKTRGRGGVVNGGGDKWPGCGGIRMGSVRMGEEEEEEEEEEEDDDDDDDGNEAEKEEE